MNTYMSGELITPGEPPITFIDWASVWSFMHGRFARPVWILSRAHRDQPDWHGSLLVHLRQDLVPLTGRLVELGQRSGGCVWRRHAQAAAIAGHKGLLLGDSAHPARLR